MSSRLSNWRGTIRAVVGVVCLTPLIMTGLTSGPAQAASSNGCLDGGFQIVNLSTGAVVASARTGDVDRTIPAASFGTRFAIRGRYIEFDVRSSDFAVLNYAFTGAANPLDITGGRRTPVWASKVPDHRGLTLTGGIEVQLKEDSLEISRTGNGLAMKIQAKDCAQGGIFQMEPERGDETATRFTHTLDPSAFFFDNPKFRARVGQFLGSGCTSVTTGPPGQFCVEGRPRVNIANDRSPKFVARDSAQVSERVEKVACNTAIPITPSVAHCGGVSIWDVASGGRMGFVTGEDAVELANPPTECIKNCQAQNRVRGRLVVLGFPFPVPAGSRLTPRF